MSRVFSLKFHLFFYGSLLAGSVFLFRLTDLDYFVSDLFFFESRDWVSTDRTFWGFVYTHLTGPSVFLVFLAIVVFCHSWLISKRSAVRWRAVCIVAAIVIGPGLLVNGLLKPQMGRPRPTDIVRYGGTDRYVPLLQVSDKGESFPSGHAASGFSLTILFYVFYRRKRGLAWTCWFGGMGLGILLSYARLAQGGHFLSDCLWSMGVTQIVNCFAYFGLESRMLKSRSVPVGTFRTSRLRVKVAFVLLTTALVALFGIGYLISFPFTFFNAERSVVPPGITRIVVDAPLEREKVKLFSNKERFVGIDHLVFAHGFPRSTVVPVVSVSFRDATMIYRIRVRRTEAFRGYRGRMKLFLPLGIETDLSSIRGDIVEDKREPAR